MIDKIYRPTFKELQNFQSREGRDVDHMRTLEHVVCMVDINNRPEFCYFVTPHETCLEVHVMVTENVGKYAKTFHKITKQMIANAFEVYDNYDILVMDIASCDEKWAESLGFKKGPNCDNLESIEGYSNYILKREDS